MSTVLSPTTDAPDLAAELSAEDVAAIDAVKQLVRTTAERLCTEEGYCADVFNKVYDASAGLDLGARPRFQYWTAEADLTANGLTIKRSDEVEATSQEHANARMLWNLGFRTPEPPAPDVSGDSEAVKAYKEKIFTLAQNNVKNIGRPVLNKYLRFMGVRELPVKRNFVFQVPLEEPSPFATYTVEAYTEEEALGLATQQVELDNSNLARGERRRYGKGNALANRLPIAGSVPTLVAPTDVNTAATA